MRIRNLAFANLKRRKGKALFLVVGIAIGIGTVVALHNLSGSIKEEIGSQLDRFGANIIILPHSNTLALDYGGISVSGVSFDVHPLKNEDSKRILEIPYRKRLSAIAPKIIGAMEIEGHPVLFAGVDFKNELKLKQWWRIVGETPAAEDDLMVGYGVAKMFSLVEPANVRQKQAHFQAVESVGPHHADKETDPFTIVRKRLRIAGREHRVAGVIASTGGREDEMIFGSLLHVQSLLNKPDQLSLIEVSALCKDCPIEDIVHQIGQQLPHAKVSAIQQSVQARTRTVERLTRFSAVVSIVVLVIGALMVFTTMMGSVIERTREIGVLRAIGFRRSHILKGLMIEVSTLSVMGGLLGWTTGTFASWVALPYFTDAGVPIEFRWTVAGSAVMAALLLGIVSSLYPALRASRLDPCEAVRYM